MSDKPDLPDYIDYATAILDAIIEGRKSAEELRGMTPDQHAEYREHLKREERAELDRGKQLLEEPES